MAAYAIFLREETIDQAELDTYAAAAAATDFAEFSPEILAALGKHEVIEGASVEGVVLLRFPSFAVATQWYLSPEYQAIVGHRLKGGRYRSLVFEGVD